MREFDSLNRCSTIKAVELKLALCLEKIQRD